MAERRGRGRRRRGRGGGRGGENAGALDLTEPYMQPHIFQWEGGGKEVFLVGSFNNWTQIPVNNSLGGTGGVFVEVSLPVGTHNYQFIVDGLYKTDRSSPMPTTQTGHSQVVITDMADLGDDMISEPMDDQASVASDIVSVYSASSDIPGGELSTQLMFKFHAAASSSIHDHLQVHACSDFVTEYKQLSPNTARVTVPESAGPGMVYNLNGSKVNGQYKLTVEPYRTRSKEKEPHGGNASRHGSSLGGNCCLYVGSNLPEYTNEQHLRDHFGKFALDITKIELIRYRNTKIFKGFGFITFSTHEVAISAMKALNHSNFLGMRVLVNFRNNSIEQSMTGISPSKAAKACEEDFSDSESVASESVYSDEIKVIVRTRPKLPTSIRNFAFKNHFKDFQSDIANSFVCRDRITKESRGFGFVFFTSTKAAEYAIEKMRGTKVLGKFEVISLRIAKDKSKNVGKSSSSPMKVQASPIAGSFQFPLSDQHSPDGIAEAVGQLSLSDQPVLSKPQDSVIIENLNPEFTESDIQSIVKVPMLSCRRLSDSSNAVLIKCHSKADAAVVVRSLNNKPIRDRCISARLASPGGPVLPLLTIPPASRTLPEYQRGVSAMSMQSESPSVVPNLPSEILQRTLSTTSTESDILSPLLQSNARSVKVTHISRNITVEQLYYHFKCAGEISGQPVLMNPQKSQFQYAYVNYLDHVSAQKAVELLHQSELGGTAITVKLSMNKIAPQSEDVSDDNFERVLKLDPKQWNSLMLVNPTTGSTLFKEVMDPFNVNPDVTFTPDYQSQSVKFSGKRETAEYAYGYLSKQLDKDFFIDRDKIEALYHLMPNLPSEVLPYGVQIIEYGPTSTAIKFEGPPAGIENAHKRVSTLVTNLCCEYVPMQHDYQMTELENLRKTILGKQYGSKVFVSISPDLVLRHILPIWSLDCSILKVAVPEIIQLMSVSCSKLDCSSEEAIYIKHFCRNSVTRLSLKVEFNEDGILLKGTPEEVEQLKAFFQSTVLNGLLSKKYSFSCKIEFKDHIEQSLLQPYSAEEQSFKYLTLMAGKEKSHKKHTQAKRDGGSNFDVYFYCTNKEFFVKVCCVFDRVSPSSKPYSITQEGMEKVVTDMKSCLENKYHIRLSQNSKSSCFIIDALIPADLQSCLNDIREQVGQKVVTSEDDISFPQEWQQQSKTAEVFPLQQGCLEWTRVYTKFSSTMSGHQTVEISRIQNKWLWEKYASHKKRLDCKNSGVVNEMELFHGTRSNDPRNIYEGEEGFDMRFSAQGMWGMANYFAANASYSNDDSYQSTKGRQMFLVKVLTGDSYQCPSNNALRKPPVKTAGTSGKEVQFAQTRYDTVTGHTNGSQVFMTYDNDKAYPAYLVTYN